MKLSSVLDESGFGTKPCLDESVFGRKCFWMKVFLDEFFRIWTKVYLTSLDISTFGFCSHVFLSIFAAHTQSTEKSFPNICTLKNDA